ncbi:MAG TPA: 6,7-dimethyl-8-ribityllumazine synthase [Terriglobales bacterium]|nr:6,7-dimethyl-8-ribityllumazine synthase [Terriglobales bacterium]
MIKWVELTVAAKSTADFKLLKELLASLGLRQGFAGESTHGQSAEFFPSRLKLGVIGKKKEWDNADLYLTVSDPDTAFNLVRDRKWKILQDHSGPEQSHLARSFNFELPGGTRVAILGPRVTQGVAETDHLALEGSMIATGKRFAVVVSRFNSFITERLLAGTLDGLARSGAKLQKDITVVRVPGAFEIPSAARTLAETRKYDAIICIGCLLRGDTAHYNVIVNEVTRGIGQSAQETGVPHAFGVLTCDTLEQAIDRAGLKMGNKGFEAALAAVEMANLKTVVGRRSSVVGKTASRKKSIKPKKQR